MLVAGDAEEVPRHPTQPHRCGDGRTDEGGVAVPCVDLVHAYPRVTERGVTEQVSQPLDQWPVAAPVSAERGLTDGDFLRGEVGDDVGSAEGVDSLFGVTDQYQRPVAVEGLL